MESKTKATTRRPKSIAKPKAEKPKADRGSESKPDSLPRLTDKQRMFVEHYLRTWNATLAARLAGYADPELSGWVNRQNEVISVEISRRIAAVAMSADEVLMRLGEQARASLKPFINTSGDIVTVDLSSEEAQANIHLLKKIKPKTRMGGSKEDPWTEQELELELNDPQAALVHLGRHHKLFTDKSEVTGKDGAPLQAVFVLPSNDREFNADANAD